MTTSSCRALSGQWRTVQLGVAGGDGLRTVVVDDGVTAVAVPELDAMGVELVVAQLVEGIECLPARFGWLAGLVPDRGLDRGSFLQAGDGALDALRPDGLPLRRGPRRPCRTRAPLRRQARSAPAPAVKK
jgi:hypothetical protein